MNMATKGSDLLALVCSALPDGFDPDLIKSSILPQLWDRNPRLAIAHALRRSGLIDWQDYLESNPDIDGESIEPAWHFLKNGVFEGRRLRLKPLLTEAGHYGQPLVSIIVYSRNYEAFLTHSLNSLTSQLLREIEIIVVDDASKDGSREIIAAACSADTRIKVIYLDAFQGAHLARKAGVAASSGRYLQFMEGQDYLTPDACAKLVQAMGKTRYQRIAFDIVYEMSRRIGLEPGIVPGLRAGRALILLGKKLNLEVTPYAAELVRQTPVNSIYNGDMCRSCFAAMPEIAHLFMPDLYEAIYLNAALANSGILQERLVFPRIRPEAGSMPDPASFGAFRSLLEQNALSDQTALFQGLMLSGMFSDWLEKKDGITAGFDNMAAQAGINALLECAINNYGEEWEKVARQFKYYKIADRPAKPRVIGILYSILVNGGAEQVIIDLTSLLTERGYEIVLFLESPHPHEEDLPPGVKVTYIGNVSGTPDAMKKHLMMLERALKSNPVDIMMFHACYAGHMLWELMLVKYLDIPVVFFPHSSFFRRLMSPGEKFGPQAQAAILACGEAVSVLSPYEELYYRSRGVNARCIPNPVRLPEAGWKPDKPFQERRNQIIVFGRLGEANKNIVDCLKVLAELIKVRPAARLTFIGDFANRAAMDDFYKNAEVLKVADRITVTGWQKDARPFIDSAGLLLACAYAESFSLTIVEAQGRGLPCAMYDLPIMPAIGNESIIRVKQGDYYGLAKKIDALLEDSDRWHRLSAIARQKASQFAMSEYIKKIEDMLASFQNYSPLSGYAPEDYRVVLRTLGFYGGQMPPWHKAAQVR